MELMRMHKSSNKSANSERAPLENPILKRHTEKEKPALTCMETCNDSSILRNRDVVSDTDEVGPGVESRF